MSTKTAPDILCPRCVTSKMLEQTWGGVAIRICMRCGANFFQAGDLAAWGGVRSDIPGPADRAARHTPAHIICPACGARMEHVEFPLSPPMVVERCLACHGVLLDFEEIRRVPEVVSWAASLRRSPRGKA